MKAHILVCLALTLAAAAGQARSAAPIGDGGGGDVSVALFSTRALHAVTLTPLSPDTWVARCPRCPHHTLTSPLHLSASTPIEIFAGGSLRLTDDNTGDARAAAGLWRLRTNNRTHELDAVLTLPSEHYVAAVLNAEAAPSEPAESLRALAILARTYALNGSHFNPVPGHLPADLCDSTGCQAMRLGQTPASIDEATRATAGETLWFHARRAEVFFSQNCGGATEDAHALWPKLSDHPYLHSRPDPYCLRRTPASWHAEVPLSEFTAIAHAERWRLPVTILSARVEQRTRSGRATRIVFTGSDGTASAVTASALRFGIGRALGWNRVRSDAYNLALRHNSLIFDGHGFGHGVGLCQAGAAEMATEGKSSREILAFYFPGTRVRITPADEGWHTVRTEHLTISGTQTPTPAQAAVLEQTWSEAQRRFPPHSQAAPKLAFAPTTEVFRQLANQPGWALAATCGSTVVLQPKAVLEAHERDPRRTLLHEMLHVLVEAEATERAPTWLREGLVEMLAGEPEAVTGREQPGLQAIDASLLRAASLEQSERAHRFAAARVRALVRRYGLSAVRGWLSSGVPPDAA